MKRLLFACIVVYLPHLLEEHLTHMADDPLIVFGLAPIADWPARAAAYLVFQVMLALSLVMTLAFAAGGWAQKAVLASLGLALVAESHHLVRFAITHRYASGLYTAWPMPFVGAFVLFTVFARKEHPSCSTTSSSPWASEESSSV